MQKRSRKNIQYTNHDFLVALGAHCRAIRIKKGYSVNRLAKEAEKLSPSVVMRLESGSGAVTINSLIRYAQVLEIPLKRLFDFSFDLDE